MCCSVSLRKYSMKIDQNNTPTHTIDLALRGSIFYSMLLITWLDYTKWPSRTKTHTSDRATISIPRWYCQTCSKLSLLTVSSFWTGMIILCWERMIQVDWGVTSPSSWKLIGTHDSETHSILVVWPYTHHSTWNWRATGTEDSIRVTSYQCLK